ncbi:MAG: carbon monoxide dehydrogenase subunit G, partial [Gammaproteobacteria bacterium]|nr:carbon monoxide dehydrogenase subunit G [Gammaproteobacteria bacterium]
MKFQGRHEIALDQARLWESLHDPEVLAKSIPGCESFDAVEGEEESYQATVATRVGPIKARFNGHVQVENTDPPNAYRLHGGGKAGAAGAAKGDVLITLKPLTDSSTELQYDASVVVTGRMAQIGAKMMKGASEAFAGEFFANLATQAVPDAGDTAGAG